MQSARKDEEKTKELFWNFAWLYLGMDLHDVLQMWYIDLPSLGASLQ